MTVLHKLDRSPSAVVFGGKCDRTTLKIEPTVMDHVTFDDAAHAGRNLRSYTSDFDLMTLFDQAIHKINSMPHPLALYVFLHLIKTAARKGNCPMWIRRRMYQSVDHPPCHQ
ncbi:MAG: hypothetical protein ACLU80_01955 [Dorea sp.]